MDSIKNGYRFWQRLDSVVGLDRSMEEVARGAGLHFNLLQVLRMYNRIPKTEDVTRLADFLGVTTEWLVTGKGQKMNKLTQELEESQEILKLARLLGKIINTEDSAM